MSKLLPFLLLILIVVGCGGSSDLATSSEARARQDFASNINQNYPFHVGFSAQGNDREILDIVVLETASPYAADGMVEMIVTDKLKKEAKALKFTQIRIKGGRSSFGSPDTIDKTISLR
jgi:hypothetical protein